jgi:penicillin-binding protein 1A
VEAVRLPGALETGYTPDANVDARPITIKGWSPRGSAPGPVPLRKAFALSINTAAVRLAQEVGFGTVGDMARRFGITTPVATNPAMALGSSEVRLVDMARAYASVANQGVAVVPYGVRRVTTAAGTVVFEHHVDGSRTLVTPWVAAQMTDLLQSVVASGTGRGAALGRPTAGKTGTTSSEKDGYFVGFSSGLTTGVWIGRDDNRRIPGLAGGKNPASAFRDYMAAAVANRPVEQFTTEVATPEWQTEEPVEEVPSEGDDGRRPGSQARSPPTSRGLFRRSPARRPHCRRASPTSNPSFAPEDRPEPVRIPLRPATPQRTAPPPQRVPPVQRVPTPPPPEPEPAFDDEF